MINKDVLGENLPNVYITSVEIANASNMNRKGGIKVKIKFSLFDYYDARTSAKFAKESGYDKTICFLTCTDHGLAQKLKEESISFHSYTEDANTKIHKTNIKKYIFRMNEINRMVGEFEFVLDKQPENLSVFCCVQKIKLSNSKKTEEGPITVEDIIIKNKINQNSYYNLIQGTRKIWPGPVHKHGSETMINSFHTSQRHSNVEKLRTFNIKIKDLREFNLPLEKEQKSFKSKQNLMLSDIYCSKNKSGAINFSYGLDLEQMYLKNNNYENTLSMLPKDLKDKIIQDVEIKNIKMYFNTNTNKSFKHFIYSRNLNKEMYSYHNENNRIIYSNDAPDQPEQVYSNLEKPKYKINNLLFLQGFLREDEVKQIKVKIIINDPLKAFINSFIRRVKINKQNLIRYSNLFRREDLFDKENQVTTKKFKEKYNNNYELWFEPIRVFIEMYRMLDNNVELQKEIINNFSLLAPKVVNRESVNHFLQKYAKLENAIKNKFQNVINKQRDNITTPKQTRRNNNVSFIEKVYNVDHRNKKKYLDYFNLPSDDSYFQSITTSQLITLINQEKSLFPSSFENASGLKQSTLNSLNSSNKASSYLRPRKVVYKNMTLDCSDMSSLNEEGINNFLDKTKIKIDKKAFGSLLVEPYEEENTSITNSDSYLNNSTLDSIANPESRDLLTKTTSKKTQGMFKNFSKKNSKFKKRFLDRTNVKNRKNFFSNKSEKEIELMPIHHKFLISDNYNPEEGKQKFLEKNKNKIDLVYLSVSRILVLKSYRVGLKNERLLNSSEFTTIDEDFINNLEKPTVCKLEKYAINDFDNTNNSFDDYEVANEYFILRPDGYVEPISERPFSDDEALYRSLLETYNTSIFEVEFLKSSFVNQRLKRSRRRISMNESQTQTRTQTRAPSRTQTRTQTRAPSRTQTRTQTRAPSRTQTRTSTRAPSRTQTRAPTRGGGGGSGY